MDPQRQIIEDGAVAIKDGMIFDVGTTAELEQQYPNTKEKVDCNYKLILPGFIDVHSHAGHCMTRTLAYDTPAHWMPILTELYHQNTRDEFWYKEGLLAAVERLKFGVTTGVSVMSNSQRSDSAQLVLNHTQGYLDVGIRDIVAVGPSNPPYPRKFTRFNEGKREESYLDLDDLLQGAEDTVAAVLAKNDERAKAFIAPFVLIGSVDSSSITPPDVAPQLTEHDIYRMKSIQEISKKFNVRIHTEAFGGMIRMAAQSEYALLGENIHLHHCLGLSTDEVKILAETKTNVSSSPGAYQLINRCPVPELMEAGVNVAVATDGTAPSFSFDIINAARKVQLAHQVALRDRYYLPPGKMLEMITIDAAKAIGMENEIGSIEVGKKADIITINMNQPHLTPQFMPVHKLMLYATGHDVDNVWVGGKILMKDRVTLTVDEYEVIREAHKESMETIKRGGFEEFLKPCDTFWGGTRMYTKENRLSKYKKDKGEWQFETMP